MERLERIKDLIGVVGIENRGTRISMDPPANYQWNDPVARDAEILDEMRRRILAKTDATVTKEGNIVAIKNPDISLTERQVLLEMIERVQEVNFNSSVNQ